MVNLQPGKWKVIVMLASITPLFSCMFLAACSWLASLCVSVLMTYLFLLLPTLIPFTYYLYVSVLLPCSYCLPMFTYVYLFLTYLPILPILILFAYFSITILFTYLYFLPILTYFYSIVTHLHLLPILIYSYLFLLLTYSEVYLPFHTSYLSLFYAYLFALLPYSVFLTHSSRSYASLSPVTTYVCFLGLLLRPTSPCVFLPITYLSSFYVSLSLLWSLPPTPGFPISHLFWFLCVTLPPLFLPLTHMVSSTSYMF